MFLWWLPNPGSIERNCASISQIRMPHATSSDFWREPKATILMARCGGSANHAGCGAARASSTIGTSGRVSRPISAEKREVMAESASAARRRPVAIVRHPIYSMLLPVPVVCFIGALLTDLSYVNSGGNLTWLNFSSWLISAGLLFGAIAGLFLLIDLLRRAGGGGGWLAFLLLIAAW